MSRRRRALPLTPDRFSFVGFWVPPRSSCPEVFVILTDSLVYVRESGVVTTEPGHAEGPSRGRIDHELRVLSAASDRPRGCIFIEVSR